MGIQYSHLSEIERFAIETLARDGSSNALIAKCLGRHRATIWRERQRGHWQAFERYLAEFGKRYYAQGRCNAGRLRRKLGDDLDTPAWRRVIMGLRCDWSPQIVAGRSRAFDPLTGPLLQSPTYVSHETIYAAIDRLPRSPLRHALICRLWQSRSGRRLRRGRGKRRFTGVQDITPISQRPASVDDRLEPGHWEGDLIKGARGQSAVGTLVERTSRRVMLIKLDNAGAHTTLESFKRRLRTIPGALRKTLTYDRGTEMAYHLQLAKAVGMQIFFCNPYSPWQRGTNENTNGLVRRYLPKGMDLSELTQQQLCEIEELLNNRPRPILRYRTPNEVFAQLRAALADAAGAAQR